MNNNLRAAAAFSVMAALLCAVGVLQSWSVALSILNLCLISAVMALGVNLQWGYAGLFNIGVMGFAALGGVAAVLVSSPPVAGAWAAGGNRILLAALCLGLTALVVLWLKRRCPPGWARSLSVFMVILGGYAAARSLFDPAAAAIEAINPSKFGYLGGFGLPVLLSWGVGGLFAAAAAWLVGRIALGLRSDYLAIATLGISEIIIAIMKNEDWLTRGVKNVTDLPRPLPYEVDLQHSAWFIDWVSYLASQRLSELSGGAYRDALQQSVVDYSGIFVKLGYTGLFAAVLLSVLWLCVRALHSPWGRMMRAIRDNEIAAAAMGKDVVARHRQVFILGSAVVGIAGAMLVTLDGQFAPTSYNPLRFTFLIWVMVIIGGSGNNLGAVLGGFVVWFVWIEAEPAGYWLINAATRGLSDDNALRQHLLDNAQYARLFLMGFILLVVMRFSPGGILPEAVRR